MAASYIYKPSTSKGPVFLAPDDRGPPIIVAPDGTEYVGVPANRRGGAFYNEGRYQYVFDSAVLGLEGATLKYGDDSAVLGSGGHALEGNSLSSLGSRAGDKGSTGSGGGGGSSDPYTPSTTPGGFGTIPANILDQFPDAAHATFNKVKKTPYDYVDPFKFGEKYGEFSRDEIRKNADLSKDLALDQVATELEGLKSFAPAASALKRSETSIDNMFNQQQRTQQLQSAFPDLQQRFGGIDADQEAQRQRAQAYAEGRAPDSVTDRGLELGLRSQAADRSSASGFSGLAAARGSDLMSAEKRLQLSQYGDQLLSSNIAGRSALINQRAALELAPTEYSDAGSQIRVTPTVSAAQLAQGNLSQLNQYGLVPASQALSSTIQQNQYETTREEQRREFNKTSKFNESMFNANQDNIFSLEEFRAKAGYAAAVAGAYNNDIIGKAALDQQKRAEEIVKEYLEKSQGAESLKSFTSLITGIFGGGGIAGFISSLGDLVNKFTGSDEETGKESSGGSSSGGSSKKPDNSSGGSEDLPSVPDPTVPGNDTSVSIPGVDKPIVPDDREVIGENADDTPIFNTDPRVAQSVKSFQSDLGLTGKTNLRSFSSSSTSLMRATGLSDKPGPGLEQAGFDKSGKPVYTSSRLAKSNDTNVGKAPPTILQSMLDPLGVLSKEDGDRLQQIATVASDVGFIAGLADSYQRGDKKGFVNSILKRTKQPIIERLTDDPKSQQGLNAAFSAYTLYNNWDKMSNAQRALGIANVGIQGFKYADKAGTDLGAKEIIKSVKGPDGKIIDPGLNVSQAIDLLSTGYNVYDLAKNWSNYNTLQKITLGTGTAAQVAKTAKDLGLTGSGTTGAAVTTSAAQLAQSGFTITASNYGVGAMIGPAGSKIPAGYQGIATGANGETIIIPQANSGTGVPTLGQVGGGATAALGAYQVYKGWGAGGAKGALNGAIGGSAIVAGLGAMAGGGFSTFAAANPYLAAGIIAVSVIGDAVKTGKSGDQMARDGVRSFGQKTGLLDKDYNVTLADGTKFNAGIDGHGGQHDIANKDLLSSAHKGKISKLNSWDIDYTNDLDYAAGMGGVALSRLTAGGKGKSVDQIGNQYGNAALGNVGYGKDFSQGNYTKTMQNLRAMYAQSGIKSKADGYQLANQAFAEHRIDAADLTATHQALNMIYDNDGYGTAQKLMNGRHRGIEVAANEADHPESIKPGNIDLLPSKAPPGGFKKPTGNQVDPGFNVPTNSSLNLTKEQMRQANAAKYRQLGANLNSRGVSL